jgi:hypothetical protein
VWTLAVVQVEGRQLLASGSDDGMVVLWESGESTPAEFAADAEARVLSDRAAQADLLDHEPLAGAITAAITHPTTEAPVTIAVKGPWGSGKSTVMNLVRDKLDPPSDDGQRSELGLPAQRRPWLATKALQLGEAFRLAGGSAITPAYDDMSAEKDPERADVPDQVERVTVWFNPWFYETGEQVWAGLAHEVISQVSSRLKRRDRERFWLRLNLRRVDQHVVRRAFYTLIADRLLKYIALSSVAAVAFAIGYSPAVGAAVFGLTVSGALIGTTVRAWFTPAANVLAQLLRGPVHDTVEGVHAALPALDTLMPDPGYEARTGYMHLIRTDLQRVIDVVAPDKARPLVVFIDDLDRCNPSTVMQTLEAINLFLAGELRNCVFVLGIEPAMLASHIETTHSELLKTLRQREPLLATEDLSWRFLEKLLQLSVRLPEPSADVVASYMGRHLGAPDSVATSEHAPSKRSKPASPATAPTTTPQVSAHTPSPTETASEPLGVQTPSAGALFDASPSGSREVRDDEAPRSAPIAPEVARQAARTRARKKVREMRLNDPRVRAILSEAVEEVESNPRALKRLINLFVFTSYVAAERALLTTGSEEAILADLRKVSHACVLFIRWPHLVERLARRPGEVGLTGRTVDGPTVLEILARASESEDWHTLTKQYGLKRRYSDGQIPEEEPELLDLQQYISSHRASIPLVAKLI